MTPALDVLAVVCPAEDMAGPSQGDWTYADYAKLPDDGPRYELINGVLYMTPSPNASHQEVIATFIAYLVIYVKQAGLGRVFPAPFDVELAPKVVVQPDILIVLKAHSERLTKNRLIGAPDLVIEIASPTTAGYDRREKQDAYANAGVPEYWIVDPTAHTIELLVLESGATYRSLGIFQGEALLPSRIVPDLPVQVEQFFA